VIDLSRAAARAVRIIDAGVAPVRLKVLRNAG
jgi:rare lipoprotein A (peptidoglycan hydrolase)